MGLTDMDSNGSQRSDRGAEIQMFGCFLQTVRLKVVCTAEICFLLRAFLDK